MMKIIIIMIKNKINKICQMIQMINKIITNKMMIKWKELFKINKCKKKKVVKKLS